MKYPAAVLLAAMSACTAPSPEAPPAEVRTVRVMRVQMQERDDEVQVFGALVPRREMRINAAAAGSVSTVYLAEGDEVEEGQIILRIANAQLAARQRQVDGELAASEQAVELAAARLESSRRHVLQRLARLEGLAHATSLARIEFERARERSRQTELRVESGAVSPEELVSVRHAESRAELQVLIASNDETVLAAELGVELPLRPAPEARARQRQEVVSSNLQTGEAELSAAIARLRVAEAEREAVADLRSSLDVRAAFAGRVAALHVAEGERVDAGTLLCSLVDSETPDVQVRVHESSLYRVAVGNPARISLPAVSETPRPAEVFRIGVVADPRSGAVPVRLRLNEADPALRPGMYAEAVIPTGSAEMVMRIPSSAILRTDTGTAFVQVLASDHVFSREIRIAAQGYGDTVEVISGIDEDTVILTRHTAQLQQGERVHALFPPRTE
ncbi:MAG: efflux RND transporter periplasmic adaptor subunit [Spirochaetaceae bacterium]|nr:MAG: efflux RND transporter periplasmic adaptor subunit [Spirochaetaceae bacterium]